MKKPTKTDPNQADPGQEWMTPAEAAQLTGVHVETIRRWIRAGTLPARNNVGGRKTRVRRADVLTVALGQKPTAPSSSTRLTHDRPSQIAASGRTILIES